MNMDMRMWDERAVVPYTDAQIKEKHIGNLFHYFTTRKFPNMFDLWIIANPRKQVLKNEVMDRIIQSYFCTSFPYLFLT